MGCTHSTTASSSAETQTSEVDVEIATDRRTAFGPGRRFLDLSRSMWGSAAAGGQTAAAHHDTSESELTIAHFVPIADLEAHGTFPRCGSDPTYVHAATGLGNANLQRPASSFDASCTCFVFVSHRWIRPGDRATGHPDDAEQSKFKVLLAGLRALCSGPASPVPRGFDVAVWIDFCCVDQDVSPGELLCRQLDRLLRTCDLLITPVVDPEHASWHYPTCTTTLDAGGWFVAYRAAAWQEYWERAWCRVEAMLGAAYPVDDHEGRAALFRGGLHSALLAGRRPHTLYGSKELAEGRAPIFLPPLLHSHFDAYRPEEGRLTQPEQDRPTIDALSAQARQRWPKLVAGFVGGLPYTGGAGAGFGKYVGEDGSAYEGEWRDGCRHGSGRALSADGNVYEGQWAHGKRHGEGKETFASGAHYEGQWEGGKPHGVGRDVWADGGVYEGEFCDGMRHGHGRHAFADGSVYEGEWRHRKKHGRGREVRADHAVLEGEWCEGRYVGRVDGGPDGAS